MENFDSKLRDAFQETMNVLNKENFISTTEESFSIGFYFILIYQLGFFNKMMIGETMIKSIDEWKEAEKVSFQLAFDRIERQIEKLSETAVVEIESIFIQLGVFDSNQYSETIIKDLFEKFSVFHKNRYDSLAIPISLSKVISSLAKIEKGSTVFNPFAGNGSLTIAFDNDNDVVCREPNHQNVELLHLRKWAWRKNDNYIIILGDCINHFNPSKKQYDLIVSMPPVLQKLDNQEPHLAHYSSLIDMVIDSSLMALNSSGKVALILPTSYLYADNFNDISRKQIIDEDLIDTVINFPSGTFENTSARFCLLLLNKRKEHPGKIRMVDGNHYILDETKKYAGLNVDLLCKDLESQSYAEHKIRLVALEEIKEQSNNLSPVRYLIPRYDESNNQHFLLSSLLRVVERKTYPLEGLFKHISINDLKSNAFDFEINASHLEVNYAKVDCTLLEEDCLLIASKGSSLKPTYFKYEGTPAIAARDIFCFTIDTSLVNIDFLIYQLHSEPVQKQIVGYRKGFITASLLLKDFFKVFIELPGLEEQNRMYSLLLENEKSATGIIAKLRNDNIKLQEEIYTQSAFLRHTLAGPISNMRAAVLIIEKTVQNQIIHFMPSVLESKLYESQELTFSMWLDVLKRDMQTISEVIASSTPEQDMLNAPLEKILIAEFIKNYFEVIKMKYQDEFELNVDIDDSLILDENNMLREVFIEGTHKMLHTLLENVVENAIKHGFVEGKERRIDVYMNLVDDETPFIHLEIGNTGKPFPKDFDYDLFYQKGSSYGPNGGSGYGGWLINQVQKRLCTSFEIYNEVHGIDKIQGLATSLSFLFKPAE